MEVKTERKSSIVNYLDDFLICQKTVSDCNFLMRKFLEICSRIGIPIVQEKTEWVKPVMTFLGFRLDGYRFKLSITDEKRIKAVNMLQSVMNRKRRKVTVKDLQQLAGLLNFLSRAIVPGRAFTRRMYAKFSGAKFNNLKQYHHMQVDQEFIHDCETWLEFLDEKSIMTVDRPYVDLKQKIVGTELEFFSDTSLNEHFGIGARYNNQWFFFAKWPENFVKNCNPSIQYIELLGLTMAVFTWIKSLAHKRVIIFCDNQPVCDMVNHTSTGDENCMFLMRKLVLKCLEYDCRIFAKHIKSEENEIADSLSRMDFNRFITLAKKRGLRPCPVPLPGELWPVNKIWIERTENKK